MEVTVIIPNFNGENFLRSCLDSLRNQSYKEFEILVVDDGSIDTSIEIIKLEYQEVKYIISDSNKGFCASVNTGILNSKTPYIILLNNDTIADENFVKELLIAAKFNHDMFSCQSKMIQAHNKKLIDDAGNLYSALGWAYARGKDTNIKNFNQPSKIFASCGGAAIYKRNVFDKIGLFDEKHFAYLEDIDIGYRAKIFGYSNYYAPKSIIYHVGSGTSGSRYNEFKIKYSSRNNIYLIYKNMPLGQIVINFIPLFIGFSIKTVFFCKKGFGKIYINGIKEGIKLCNKENKVKFKFGNTYRYLKIQLELWINMFRRF